MRLAIVEENGSVFDIDDTGIGDSHSEDVRGQILQACLAGANGLGIDNPVHLPDLGGNLMEEPGLFHRITELGPEDWGESLNREIKIDPGGVPEAVGRGEGAARDDIMDMGVKLEGSSPGVKDAQEPREICADELFIGDQSLDRFGRSFKEGRVGCFLVGTDEAA